MKRGDVYWADLAPRSGSEQQGRRPVIVVSHDAFNGIATWKSVIVVPLSTSSLQAVRGPSAVPIAGTAAGLTRPSIALCHQVTTLDRGKLTGFVGRLPETVLQAVDAGLATALSLFPPEGI